MMKQPNKFSKFRITICLLECSDSWGKIEGSLDTLTSSKQGCPFRPNAQITRFLVPTTTNLKDPKP